MVLVSFDMKCFSSSTITIIVQKLLNKNSTPCSIFQHSQTIPAINMQGGELLQIKHYSKNRS